VSHLGTGHEFLSLSVVQFKCTSAQSVQSLLADTPCLVVSVLVVWSAIACFGHCAARSQSIMMIIRGPEDVIYKENLKEVESLAKCLWKERNNWCCLVGV